MHNIFFRPCALSLTWKQASIQANCVYRDPCITLSKSIDPAICDKTREGSILQNFFFVIFSDWHFVKIVVNVTYSWLLYMNLRKACFCIKKWLSQAYLASWTCPSWVYYYFPPVLCLVCFLFPTATQFVISTSGHLFKCGHVKYGQLCSACHNNRAMLGDKNVS